MARGVNIPVWGEIPQGKPLSSCNLHIEQFRQTPTAPLQARIADNGAKRTNVLAWAKQNKSALLMAGQTAPVCREG